MLDNITFLSFLLFTMCESLEYELTAGGRVSPIAKFLTIHVL